MRWLARSMFASVLVMGCGSGTKSDLRVMSFSPAGPVEKTEALEIKFDQPVVDESYVGLNANPAMVVITPAVEWKGYWHDRQTLSIEPQGELAPSTKYQVTLAGDLGVRTGGFGFSFVHRPLAVEGVWGADPLSLAPGGPIPISFNQPVHAAGAAKHCKLASKSGDIALVAADTSGPPGTNVSLAPARPLAAGQDYTLTCAQLTGSGGNTPLAAPYSLAVRARPLLAVTELAPTGQDIGADEVAITVSFTTPVTLDAARKALTSKPRIPGLDGGYLSGDGTQYKVTTNLEVTTDYVLTVAGLEDQFGQTLAKPVTHAFRTGDAAPRLSMERGIFAVEASAKGYPVWSRNVGAIDVSCGAIPRDRIVQVLTTDMNYDPWGGTEEKDIDWKKLKARPRVQTIKTTGKNKWLLHELDLGARCASTPGARGVFLAEVTSEDIVPDTTRSWYQPRRNRVLANVTDMGVLVKTGTSSGLVWVTSLSTGAPVSGARVSIYTPQGAQVWTDTSNTDGVVKVPGSAILKAQKASSTITEEEEFSDWDSHRSQRLIAIVEKGADLAVVDGNWANGLQIWNFGVSEDRTGGVSKVRGFIQSDRGLYRPGETVHFKGIVREVAQGTAPRVPAAKRAAVEVQDSRGQTVLSTSANLTAFGGFAFDLPLGAEAAVGDYHVSATVANQTFRERFSVEEFRTAAFEVGLASGAPAKAVPRPGDRLRFALDATYLFGAPLGGAKVEWSLRRRNHPVRFAGYEQYTFDANPNRWWWDSSDDDYGQFISDGQGVTTAQGTLVIAARDSETKFEGPVDYILSANVTDSADQTIGKSAIITAHKSSLYLGLFANEYVQAVGMPFGVNLVALAPDGARLAARAKLSFTRIERTCEWSNVGARSYHRCTTQNGKPLEREITVAAGGAHVERLSPTEPGEYVVRVEGKDARGHEVSAASSIYVVGKGEAFWSGDEGDRMTLIASKPKYKVGETARLVPQANLVAPTALITIERDGIIDARVMKLASPSEGVELPIQDAWAPNVYASIALVSGRRGAGDRHRPQFKMGLVELVVESTHKQLDVQVSLAQAEVRPGELVTGVIKVTHAGQPVKAEVSLSAADEGVLQLISYVTPNPMKTFYASYGLGVDTATNWNRIARLADPQSGDPDEGGDSAATSGPRVRSKFLSSAYWAPLLVTDDAGQVAFSFPAPDNLTAFRLMAVAADIGDRFGAGEQRLTVNKPLMAAPALPRFLRSGDSASVGVVVHNHTSTAGKATVTAKAVGATLTGGPQSVDVPAHGSARVRFGTRASENAAATYEFAVAMNSERDAVKVTLPIDRPRVIDNRLVVEKMLAAGETWKGVVGASADVLRSESYLQVTVDRSGVGDLAPSLRALVEYPYGCLEQTMSRFIPLLAARDLANTLDDPTLKGTQATRFIRAGTAKVIRHQQGDGLFSLWPQSETHPHLAAYALWGLTVAEKAGEKVPAEVFTNGLAALARWSNEPGIVAPDGNGATLAMTAYVMALRGTPDANLVARLYAVRKGLPKWGLAFLYRAMHVGKADAAQLAEVKALVASGITKVGDKAFVREALTPEQYGHFMTSDVRASALTLGALLEAEPTSELVAPLVAGLKSERTGNGAWVTTQENLWSLVALADYGRRAAKGSATATVTVGGAQVMRQKVTGAQVSTVKVPLSKITGDDLAIAVDGGAAVSARVVEARKDAGDAQSDGFTLARSYLDKSGTEVSSVKAGDIVTVRLSIVSHATRQWVALVDPLPAGFEVLNAKLVSGGTDLSARSLPGSTSSWRNTVAWVHQEMRDDRVRWFADHMFAGAFEVTYQVRATIDGTFLALPATIEEMYAPANRGRTSQTTMTVTR